MGEPVADKDYVPKHALRSILRGLAAMHWMSDARFEQHGCGCLVTVVAYATLQLKQMEALALTQC